MILEVDDGGPVFSTSFDNTYFGEWSYAVVDLANGILETVRGGQSQRTSTFASPPSFADLNWITLGN